MSTTAMTPTVPQESRPAPVPAPTSTMRQRAAAAGSSALGIVSGAAPHVLHHVGPLAGAALLAGTAGTLLFGAIGLLAAVPFLLRVHRRCGTWRTPAALLALFALMFSISAFVIGPAISGSDSGGSNQTEQTAPGAPQDGGHSSHHS